MTNSRPKRSITIGEKGPPAATPAAMGNGKLNITIISQIPSLACSSGSGGAHSLRACPHRGDVSNYT